MEGYYNDEEMEEVNPLIDNGDNNLGTMEFDMDNEVANALSSGKYKPLMNEQ